MKTTLLSFLIALLTLTGAPAMGAEALDVLLQKRTLDVDIPRDQTLVEALAELAARYKAKYGEELPLFISAALLPDPAAPKPKPVQAPAIPGIDDPPESLKSSSPVTRLGGRLNNVPIVEILKYYANLSNTAYTVRGDVAGKSGWRTGSRSTRPFHHDGRTRKMHPQKTRSAPNQERASAAAPAHSEPHHPVAFTPGLPPHFPALLTTPRRAPRF